MKLTFAQSINFNNGIFLFSPTAVNCFDLSDPPNGMVEFSETTFMSTATYSCSAGFALIGEPTRECLSTEVWSGIEPTCVGECNIYRHIAHACGVF